MSIRLPKKRHFRHVGWRGNSLDLKHDKTILMLELVAVACPIAVIQTAVKKQQNQGGWGRGYTKKFADAYYDKCQFVESAD